MSSVWASESIDLGDVSVTATRSDTNSTDLQASVLKASTENVETTVLQKDLLNGVAGVLTTQTTSGLGHMMSIRTPITTNARFLYLQDGIPVQSSGFFNHNGLAYTNFSSAGGVEVLKGAGTALYGSDAIAGTVNVQAPQKIVGTSVEARGGSFGYGSLAIKKGDKLEDGSYYIGVSQAHKDGWKEHSAFDRSELTLRKDKIINDDNSLKVILSANKSDAEQSGDIIGLDALNNEADSLGSLDLSKVDAKRKFDYARLSAQWTNFSYDKVEIDTIFYGRSNRNRYTATWKSSDPHNDSQQNTIGIMNKTTFEKSWGKFLIGLDTEYTKASQLTTQDFEYDTATGSDKNVSLGSIYDYNVNYFAIAPYLHSEGSLSKNLKFTAGLRFDYNAFDYTNNTETGEYGTSGYVRVADRSDSFSHLSPKFSLAYKAAADNILYLR